MTYFDYNSTTPLNRAAKDALFDAVDGQWANPSSPYKVSARVRLALDTARENLADRLHGKGTGMVFTGGATEANNSVIRYLAEILPQEKGLAISAIEHPSVMEPANHFFKGRLDLLPVSPEGVLDVDHLGAVMAAGRPGAVSVMAANNETGVIQPWDRVGRICRENGVAYHCDASQWFGKCPNYRFDNCDFLVGCSHKFGGPKGVGFLALSENWYGFRSVFGGPQEGGRRGGTENIPGILSMVAALGWADRHREGMLAQKDHRDVFEDRLIRGIPGLKCVGKSAPRLPNTSFVILPIYENLRWVTKLDVKGFQVSTGSACATGKTGRSPTMRAMDFTRGESRRTIRVSSGPQTGPESWADLAEAFLETWQSLKPDASCDGLTEVISV
ncbi:MAG: aminotransferase class V-fold PLP-dependent enzyme [Opitutae bacterium]|nr:aminotransferase class V-fold PLP-dependent enzyme [Opitutae bacterium]